ncbi:hypothetical protein [Streptomyces sp. WZ-12]|uniref:hypothetical protein n=1 Tax=Streptomyces sp. WZ-12 TaxID=3030210 RepID=UPI00238164C3|nr:hypothetical protein [Streptomyces sp. WZ-12]
MLTVVSVDVDTGAGVAAVWALWRPKSARVCEYTVLLEWYEEQWRCVGGAESSSGSVDDPADVEVIEVRGGGGVLSLTRDLDPAHSMGRAPWIGCVEVHLGPDVRHLLVGDRRIVAPERRKLLAVWASRPASRAARPVLVALGHEGTELSRIGPHDCLDTHTWARLREEW